MNQPLVSIIIPSFNKRDFIIDTIQSVIHQTYTNLDLIIIDDFSTDESQSIIADFSKKDTRIQTILNKENRGGNYCRNQGIHVAKGEYLIFLDADDVLSNACIEQRIAKVELQPDCDLWIFPLETFMKTPGDSKGQRWIPPDCNTDFLSLFLAHELPWQTMQPLWRTSFIRKTGGFDETFVRLQDVELHTRALYIGARVVSYPTLEPDCFFRTDESRFGFENLGYLQKTCKGAKQYYIKFYSLVNLQQKKLLSLTLLKIISYILFQQRIKSINKSQSRIMWNDLIGICQNNWHRFILNVYCRIYNLSPFHPKGLQFITAKVIRFY
jgi:glycosyltransferase involved in cell wall biosynthesis